MLCLNVITLPSAQEAGRHLRDIGIGALPLLFILGTVLLWVLYIRSLQSALRRCSPESRAIAPEKAWLLLIPVFRSFMHFWIVSGLTESLDREFKMRKLPKAPDEPGKKMGTVMCILPILFAGVIGIATRLVLFPAQAALVTNLAKAGVFLGLSGVVFWIGYWVKIAQYSRLLEKAPAAPEADSSSPAPATNRSFLPAGMIGLSLFLILALPPAVGFLLFVVSGRAAEASDAYAVIYPHWYNRFLFTGEYVGLQEVQKVTILQVRSRYPQYADNPMILRVFEQQVGAQLVEQKVLAIEANRRGLHATDGDVSEFLHQGEFGAFLYPQGKYIGDSQFSAFVTHQFGFSVDEFKQELKLDLAIKKLQEQVTKGVTVNDDEVRESYRKSNAKIKFDYAVIDGADLLKSINPSESDLESFFQHNAARYANAVPEQARSRHILIAVTQGADPHADALARAKAEGLLKQIQNGADFADLARKFSDDPGSKEKGGELGFAQRGSMVPEFDKALFSQKIGETQIVKSQFGYHLVQVEERNAAHAPTFADVKSGIADDYRRDQFSILLKEKTTDLAAKAKAENDLARAAKETGASLHSSDLVGAGDQVPLIGRVGQTAPQLFDLKPGEFSGPINAGRTGVVARLVDKQLPSSEEIAKNFLQARTGLLEQRKSQVFNGFLKTLMDEYKKAGRISISKENT
ncbi:MAG TPA: peptidylprolyl isomerase, partial [Terracidiphilus sp.]